MSEYRNDVWLGRETFTCPEMAVKMLILLRDLLCVINYRAKELNCCSVWWNVCLFVHHYLLCVAFIHLLFQSFGGSHTCGSSRIHPQIHPPAQTPSGREKAAPALCLAGESQEFQLVPSLELQSWCSGGFLHVVQGSGAQDSSVFPQWDGLGWISPVFTASSG